MIVERSLRMTKLAPLLACAVASLALAGCLGDPSVPDAFEPSSEAMPADLNAFSDSGTNADLDLTLHDANDEDAFVFDILDQGIDGNPEVFIAVDGDGAADLAVTLDFQCDDGSGNAKRQDVGARVDLAFTTSCPGGGFFDDDDSGTAILTVRRAPGSSTQPMFYDLRIHVD